MSDKFDYHLEKAIEATIRKEDLNCSDKNLLKSNIARHIRQLVHHKVDGIVSKLVSKTFN